MLTGRAIKHEYLHIPSLGKRVKFTCVGATRRHLALGASTGAVYVYTQAHLRFVRVLHVAPSSSMSASDAIAMIRFRYVRVQRPFSRSAPTLPHVTPLCTQPRSTGPHGGGYGFWQSAGAGVTP